MPQHEQYRPTQQYQPRSGAPGSQPWGAPQPPPSAPLQPYGQGPRSQPVNHGAPYGQGQAPAYGQTYGQAPGYGQQPYGQQPMYAPPAVGLQNNVQVVVQQAPTNGLGTGGFVCGLLGFFLSWIPILGGILSLVGLILSGFGMTKNPKGLAIAGLVLSVLGLIGSIVWWSIFWSVSMSY